MIYRLIFFVLILSACSIQAQIYSDHFGTGNGIGVMVTSSNSSTDSTAAYSLNGTGYLVDSIGAYRFLAQAGFGGDALQIDTLMKLGIEDWLDWQMTMPYETYFDRYNIHYNEIVAGMEAANVNVNNIKFPLYLTSVFYDKVLIDEDAFRQKAAFALSQIFVINMWSHFGQNERRRKGWGYATYYDILYEGAFGNFRDLLENVTLSPVMGDYLTYINNQKEDTIKNIQPDENYAREIMQLFTIGLIELNNDGTPKLDDNGETIATYNPEDVREMAQVFTGLYGAAIVPPYDSFSSHEFGRSVLHYDWTLPMIMDTSYHDTSPKILPDSSIIPARQYELDIKMALDWLFKHDNVGPFIARRLIQQLVKSNPTPEYINRVATAFNNNGNDVRGDMGAVFKAILLDPEARTCEWMNHPYAGKLLQPMEKNINLFKAFGLSSPSGIIRLRDFYSSSQYPGEERYTMQAFLKSPSVFNFFSPFYSESEFVDTAGLVSPEFEILNSVTSIHYLNRTRDMIERMARDNYGFDAAGCGCSALNSFANINDNYRASPFQNYSDYSHITLPEGADKPEIDFQKEVCICEGDGTNKDIETLLAHLDLVLCRGQLSQQTKNMILNNINHQIKHNTSAYQELLNNWRAPAMFNDSHLDYPCLEEEDNFNCLRIVKEMVYLIMLSPDYNILK